MTAAVLQEFQKGQQTRSTTALTFDLSLSSNPQKDLYINIQGQTNTHTHTLKTHSHWSFFFVFITGPWVRLLRKVVVMMMMQLFICDFTWHTHTHTQLAQCTLHTLHDSSNKHVAWIRPTNEGNLTQPGLFTAKLQSMEERKWERRAFWHETHSATRIRFYPRGLTMFAQVAL